MNRPVGPDFHCDVGLAALRAEWLGRENCPTAIEHYRWRVRRRQSVIPHAQCIRIESNVVRADAISQNFRSPVVRYQSDMNGRPVCCRTNEVARTAFDRVSIGGGHRQADLSSRPNASSGAKHRYPHRVGAQIDRPRDDASALARGQQNGNGQEGKSSAFRAACWQHTTTACTRSGFA